MGPDKFSKKLLNTNSQTKVTDLNLDLLGPFPMAGTIARGQFQVKMQEQRSTLVNWWLDRLTDVDNPLTERMTWFWHGHWATSLGKVEYSNAMLRQNQTIRRNALGNFKTFANEMIMDGALQFWLDNNSNTVKAPNENLARELMELFTLGVNRYTETDIKEAAKALTGYSLDRESGEVTFNPSKHDSSVQTILGKSANFDGQSLVEFLVSRDDCATFIAERIWFRFINDSTPLPDTSIQSAFSNRDIFKAITAAINHAAIKDEANSLVRPPLEWFISACRALQVTPSKLGNSNLAQNYLDKLSQKPFYPPNVGGWPTGEIWLTAANAQYRIELAQILVKAGDITPISNVIAPLRVNAVLDLFGFGDVSERTRIALVAAQTDPERLITTALCAPEYLVSV